jgi:7,8-dihydropterin-6-yl-methyl-4-(beta-D-ribofuranosyl)aminobenzene 5'-phosphate synthase
MNGEKKYIPASGVKDLTVTIVYDNNPCKEGMETEWGFSCLITGAEKTILFDTGRGCGLLGNMQRLQIPADSVDIVFLSHIHRDHTGGLNDFLERNSKVHIYLPKSFPKKFKDKVQLYGAKIVEVEESLKICEDVYSTGQVGRWMREQAMVVHTDKGLVIITGCSHPGIIKVLNKAKDLLRKDLLFVMGGFHLEWTSTSRIEKIISAFKKMGVRCVGACHCSGDKARKLFEKHFGKNYINIGAGKVIAITDLQ